MPVRLNSELSTAFFSPDSGTGLPLTTEGLININKMAKLAMATAMALSMQLPLTDNGVF